MKRDYQTKLKNIETWVEIVDHHWHRLRGQLHNDTEFWDDTLHAMQDQDWWDWVDIEPAIKIQHEYHYRRYGKLTEDTKDIYKMLALGKPVTRKNGAHKNITAFRTLMSIHDLFNDIKGTPTRQFSAVDTIEEQATPFEKLFDV